ncbi:MAG: Uma2 family endonuclease [Candidatus Melainabacteria bacterium]|nr:Uma2 family endonuclease [Candidatus Melainabacteria bacterium]
MKKTNTPSHLTADEYLRAEEGSALRSEFVDGRVFAMTGTTLRHNALVNNIYAALRAHLKNCPCKAYTIDVKVHVQSANSFYYPDVVVTCSGSPDQSLIADSPVFIAEVLSRSTSLVDRREKVVTYKQIPSLKEYLIVHQTKKKVELHRRLDSNSWEILVLSAGELQLLADMPCNPMRITFDELYDDIQFDSNFVKEESTEYEASQEWDFDY